MKVDGFRALAHIDAGNGERISRNGNTFHGFADLAASIAQRLRLVRLPAGAAAIRVLFGIHKSVISGIVTRARCGCEVTV
jgi:hypothetical protein